MATSYGSITIVDITDISDVYFEYALVSDSITDYRYIPSETVWDTNYPTWQTGFQIWKRQVQKKEGAGEERGTPFLDMAVNQLNNSINLLNSRAKYFWNNSSGTHVASGNDKTFDESDSTTYGFNSLLATGALNLQYNGITLVGLNANSGLSLYIPTISNNKISGSILGMRLNTNSLSFYKPSTTDSSLTTAATLDSHGLVLSEGGIVAGQALTNNFIYLSTEDYPLRQYTVTTDVAINNTKTYYTYNSETQRYSLVDTPDVSQISNYYEISNPGLTVNRHTPGDATNDPPWRQVIGSKFGVDASGTLYASGAELSDTLTIRNKSGQVVASYGQTTIIGNKERNQSYIEISDDGISFYGTGQPENPSASINGQYMYIPYTVVLNEMIVGQREGSTPSHPLSLWSWKKMDNENLRLVWLGGDN